MAKTKAGIPQGTRDFGPDVVRKRNYILDTIRNVFELYGFQPLETPAMENIDTLMGKYGEEGDKLIFKILNNGLDNVSKREEVKTDFEKILDGKNSKGITERALKYDLTIPFARYVAMNHGQLSFPFKRYQIQPVWRADRPQKGRYREFYQCDADVVGSTSLANEVELCLIYDEVFARLGIENYSLKVNHRKILSGVAEAIGAPNKMVEMTIAIDKFDKIGLDGVKKELTDKKFTREQINDLTDFIFIAAEKVMPISVQLEEGEDSALHFLKNAAPKYATNENFRIGVAELNEIIKKSKILSPKSKIQVDLTLARGLNYYTGIIFEVKAKGVNIGSIGGGGRYDDLTGLFGVPNIPGVGISFGVDRIYDVMEELNLFPADVYVSTQVLFFNMGEKETMVAFEKAQELRKKNIRCEIYHEAAKFEKQFKYAEKKNIPFVIIIGEEELKNNTCKIKNIVSGKQTEVKLEEISKFPFEV